MYGLARQGVKERLLKRSEDKREPLALHQVDEKEAGRAASPLPGPEVFQSSAVTMGSGPLPRAAWGSAPWLQPGSGRPLCGSCWGRALVAFTWSMFCKCTEHKS